MCDLTKKNENLQKISWKLFHVSTSVQIGGRDAGWFFWQTYLLLRRLVGVPMAWGCRVRGRWATRNRRRHRPEQSRAQSREDLGRSRKLPSTNQPPVIEKTDYVLQETMESFAFPDFYIKIHFFPGKSMPAFATGVETWAKRCFLHWTDSNF